jgi:hypothetical protein
MWWLHVVESSQNLLLRNSHQTCLYRFCCGSATKSTQVVWATEQFPSGKQHGGVSNCLQSIRVLWNHSVKAHHYNPNVFFISFLGLFHNSVRWWDGKCTMNWKIFGRKQSKPNQGDSLVFPWRPIKSQKTSVKTANVQGLRLKSSTHSILT